MVSETALFVSHLTGLSYSIVSNLLIALPIVRNYGSFELPLKSLVDCQEPQIF